ncbi:TPA: hypothetical protein ACH3X1_007561 [Trebouxia sp. C0004]
MYAAADDDDDDLFAEFDVDMDMDGEPAPPAKPSTSNSEEADNMHMDVDRDTTTPAADATPEDTGLPVNTKTAQSSVSHDAAAADLHKMTDKPPQSGKSFMSRLQVLSRWCKLSGSGCAYAGPCADIAAIQPAEPAGTITTSADTETHEPAADEDSDTAMPTRAENISCKVLPEQSADPLHQESALPSAPNALGTQQREDGFPQREEQMLSSSSYHQAQAEEQPPADHQDVPMQIEKEHAQPKSDAATNQQQQCAADDTPTSKANTTEDAQHKTAHQSDVHLPGAITTQLTGEASHMPGSCSQGMVQADIAPESAAQDVPLLVIQGVYQTADAICAQDSLTEPVPSEPLLAEETGAERGAHQREVSDMLRAISGNRPAAAASNAVSANAPSTDRTAFEPTMPGVATQNATHAPKVPDLSSPLQAQSLATCVPKAPVALPVVVITASKPTKQASSSKSLFSIPSSCKPPPSSATKHALTPLGKSQSKMVFRTTISSPLSAPAFKAVNAPSLTQPARAAFGFAPPAAKSAVVPAGTMATTTLPSQHNSIKQPTAQGLAGLTPTSASIGKPKNAGNKEAPAAQAPFKFSSLPVPQSKPVNARGPVLNGFPKQPAGISGGSTRLPAVPMPSFHVAPLQTAARSKASGLSRAPIVLPGNPCVIRSKSATPVHQPVGSAPAVPKAASPGLPVTGPAHSTDTDQQLSPIAGITRTPAVKQAQQQQQPLPQTNETAVSPSCGDVGMSAPDAPVEKDAVMGGEGENSLPTAKPWTSTSLAGGLMGNMKHLEAMLFEVQQMHDDILECKVDVAISSNRLTRLDNPIVHDKLRSLKRQAEKVFQASTEE